MREESCLMDGEAKREGELEERKEKGGSLKMSKWKINASEQRKKGGWLIYSLCHRKSTIIFM